MATWTRVSTRARHLPMCECLILVWPVCQALRAGLRTGSATERAGDAGAAEAQWDESAADMGDGTGERCVRVRRERLRRTLSVCAWAEPPGTGGVRERSQ